MRRLLALLVVTITLGTAQNANAGLVCSPELIPI